MDAPINFTRCPRGCIGITALEELYQDFVFPSALDGSASPKPAVKGYVDPTLLENFGKYLALEAAPLDP